MNLERYIKILLINLSEKYDISIVNVMNAREGKTSSKYTVNIKEKKEDSLNKRYHFNSKQELVSWLLCQS